MLFSEDILTWFLVCLAGKDFEQQENRGMMTNDPHFVFVHLNTKQKRGSDQPHEILLLADIAPMLIYSRTHSDSNIWVNLC